MVIAGKESRNMLRNDQGSEPFEVEGFVDLELEGQILLVGEPVEEVFNEPGDVGIGEKGDFLELEVSAVPWHVLQHEGVDDIDDVADRLSFHFGVLHLLGIGRVFFWLLRLAVVFIDRSRQHHEKREKAVEVVRLV